MAQLREMEELQQTISGLEAHIRGMSVPAQDRIWSRFRQEEALLTRLLNFDLRLVRESQQLYEFMAQLAPEGWNMYSSGTIRSFYQQLTQIANEREQLLLMQL
jgi:hypothetical protein